MIFTSWNKHRHIGLLILRIGLGCMFLFHGAPKMFGGPEEWKDTGMAMKSLGIGFMPMFWGLMAAIFRVHRGTLPNSRSILSPSVCPFNHHNDGCCYQQPR